MCQRILNLQTETVCIAAQLCCLVCKEIHTDAENILKTSLSFFQFFSPGATNLSKAGIQGLQCHKKFNYRQF
jgi:hypothetical protein